MNRILPGIQTYAYNGDCSKVAICPQSAEILIFETLGKPTINDWKLVQVLKEHFSLVTALDWHPQTGLLLSCSSDRGIIVWEMEKASKKLMPQLCNIKELKANTDAAWSTKGDKFVVGAASGYVFVGSFNNKVNLWIAQAISDKPTHDAPVTKVCFDPIDGKCIASASADGQVQFNSDFNEDIDSPTGTGPFGNITDPMRIFKMQCGEWVNSVSFSPSGTEVAFATHDSMMHFFSITEADVQAKKKPASQKFSYPGAPIMTGCFISETAYVGSGYDKTPLLFLKKDGQWQYSDRLDPGSKKNKVTTATGKDAFAGKNIYFEHPLDATLHMKETESKHMNYINC